MENNVNEVVEMTEDVVKSGRYHFNAGMKSEGKWIAIGAGGAALIISAGVGIKKLIDAKKAPKKLTEKTDKKSLLEKLSDIHFRKKSKNITEENVTEKKPIENS